MLDIVIDIVSHLNLIGMEEHETRYKKSEYIYIFFFSFFFPIGERNRPSFFSVVSALYSNLFAPIRDMMQSKLQLDSSSIHRGNHVTYIYALPL